MKAKLIGKHLEDIIPLLEARGFELTDEPAELIIAHGGDGALLDAERLYPGIPKLPIRDRKTAPLCQEHSYEKQLDEFCAGNTEKTLNPKLYCAFGGREMFGLNDIFIHNSNRARAMRYRVWINDELYAHEIVGDAVGMSTVHGSTAYYRSITHSIFKTGLGLAFSNSTEVVNHLVLPDDAVVKIRVLRGPGLIIADNDPDFIEIPQDCEVVIHKAKECAVIYGLANFMCQQCRLLRHPRQFKNENPFVFTHKNSQ
jgi:NAD+ kinase